MDIEVLDSLGNRVISGPDSVLAPTVVATNATGGAVPLCTIFRTRCAGAYSTNHISACNSSEGLVLSQGALQYTPSVCQVRVYTHALPRAHTNFGLLRARIS